MERRFGQATDPAAGRLPAGVDRRGFVRLAGCAGALALTGGLVGCALASQGEVQGEAEARDGGAADAGSDAGGALFTPGTREDRGFTLDNVYRAPDGSDIHFSLRLPSDLQGVAVDGSGADLGEPRPLYIALPG